MSFQTNTFIFETLRSDYDAAMNILMKYVDQDKFLVKDVTSYIRGKDYIIRFTLKGDFWDYEKLCDELEENWLLV